MVFVGHRLEHDCLSGADKEGRQHVFRANEADSGGKGEWRDGAEWDTDSAAEAKAGNQGAADG